MEVSQIGGPLEVKHKITVNVWLLSRYTDRGEAQAATEDAPSCPPAQSCIQGAGCGWESAAQREDCSLLSPVLLGFAACFILLPHIGTPARKFPF